MLTQEDFEECLQDQTSMYEGGQGYKTAKAARQAILADREELLLQRDLLLAACEATWNNWYETYAESHLKVYGTWDGLRIPEHVAMCRAAIAKANGANAHAHDWERLPAGGPWVARCRVCGLQRVEGEEVTP
jgi:hypothetical protein